LSAQDQVAEKTVENNAIRELDRRGPLIRGSAFLAIMAFLLLLVFWSFPFLRASAGGSLKVPADEVKGYPEYSQINQKLRGELTPFPEHTNSKAEAGIHPLSPLVFVEFVIIAAKPAKESLSPINSTPPESPEISVRDGVLHFRADRLIGTLAGAAILPLLLILISESRRSSWDSKGVRSRPTQLSEFGFLLYAEIERYDQICSSMWKRSRFLLGGGVLAALGGIGALYYLVSNEAVAKEFADLAPLVRAAAIVLYVESFAFLLLRQHRSAVEDFKYFNSLRLRLLHFIISAQAQRDSLGPSDPPSMARLLLAEDPFMGQSPRALKEKGEPGGASSNGDELLSKVLDSLSKRIGQQGSGDGKGHET
jgi:hypothetical protein